MAWSWRPRGRSRRVAVIVVVMIVAGAAITGLAMRSNSTHSQLPRPTAEPTAATTTPAPGQYLGPPVPTTGALLGAYVPAAGNVAAKQASSFGEFESAIGASLPIAHEYRIWSKSFGSAADIALIRDGKQLLLSWTGTDTIRIANGLEDAAIEAAASAISSLKAKVYLQLRWEMDRPGLQSIVHSPKDFIAAWKHVRAIFAARHVDNVGWVWCPTAVGFENGRAMAYYPGDSSVDWICADVYPEHSFTPGTYESFPSLIKAFIAWATPHGKPIMIGETGVPVSYGAQRSDWIATAGQYVEAHPQIKALVYFDLSDPSEKPYSQYGLEGDGPALQAFGQLANDSYFHGG
jgi:hypothetical protein